MPLWWRLGKVVTMESCITFRATTILPTHGAVLFDIFSVPACNYGMARSKSGFAGQWRSCTAVNVGHPSGRRRMVLKGAREGSAIE